MSTIDDDEIRRRLHTAIYASNSLHDFGLSVLDCRILARSLVEPTKDIVRAKRPIHRGPSYKPIVAKRAKRINEETREKASQSRQRWTPSELAIALDRNLTQEEAARRLGRSFLAVRSARKRYRHLGGTA